MNILQIDEELIEICQQIKSENKSVEEWREIESSDMFQTAHYCGGFESDEAVFTFSYYSTEGEELWLYLELEQVMQIIEGKITEITVSNPQ